VLLYLYVKLKAINKDKVWTPLSYREASKVPWKASGLKYG